MQLWQLGLLVGFGVALIVYLVHLSGGSRKAFLGSDKAAINRFAEDFPSIKPEKATLTKFGNAAFLHLPDGTLGLVHAFGDGYLTRILDSSILAGSKSEANFLSVRLADFTFPGARYEFADADAARDIQRQLNYSLKQD
jgi:hypothetical protein